MVYKVLIFCILVLILFTSCDNKTILKANLFYDNTKRELVDHEPWQASIILRGHIYSNIDEYKILAISKEDTIALMKNSYEPAELSVAGNGDYQVNFLVEENYNSLTEYYHGNTNFLESIRLLLICNNNVREFTPSNDYRVYQFLNGEQIDLKRDSQLIADTPYYYY